MTFNDKGLLRAMKKEYKGDGYIVAGTEGGFVICCESWGVYIREQAMPNTVKSVVVLHAGKLPEVGKAIKVRKTETASWIFEMAVDRMDGLYALYTEKKRETILPTRLTMDGYGLWQNPRNLEIQRIAPENQQILDFTDNDAYLIDGTIYGVTIYGSVYVACEHIVYEDKPLVACLEQMQWIPVEVEHDA